VPAYAAVPRTSSIGLPRRPPARRTRAAAPAARIRRIQGNSIASAATARSGVGPATRPGADRAGGRVQRHREGHTGITIAFRVPPWRLLRPRIRRQQDRGHQLLRRERAALGREKNSRAGTRRTPRPTRPRSSRPAQQRRVRVSGRDAEPRLPPTCRGCGSAASRRCASHRQPGRGPASSATIRAYGTPAPSRSTVARDHSAVRRPRSVRSVAAGGGRVQLDHHVGAAASAPRRVAWPDRQRLGKVAGAHEVHCGHRSAPGLVIRAAYPRAPDRGIYRPEPAATAKYGQRPYWSGLIDGGRTRVPPRMRSVREVQAAAAVPRRDKSPGDGRMPAAPGRSAHRGGDACSPHYGPEARRASRRRRSADRGVGREVARGLVTACRGRRLDRGSPAPDLLARRVPHFAGSTPSSRPRSAGRAALRRSTWRSSARVRRRPTTGGHPVRARRHPAHLRPLRAVQLRTGRDLRESITRPISAMCSPSRRTSRRPSTRSARPSRTCTPRGVPACARRRHSIGYRRPAAWPSTCPATSDHPLRPARDTQETDLDERMHTTPWFHATDLPNVPAKNWCRSGSVAGRRRGPGEGRRERGTTIMTVTDCVEMGIEAAAERALEVAWDGTEAVLAVLRRGLLDAAFVPGRVAGAAGSAARGAQVIQLIAAHRWPVSSRRMSPPYDNADITRWWPPVICAPRLPGTRRAPAADARVEDVSTNVRTRWSWRACSRWPDCSSASPVRRAGGRIVLGSPAWPGWFPGRWPRGGAVSQERRQRRAEILDS